MLENDGKNKGEIGGSGDQTTEKPPETAATTANNGEQAATEVTVNGQFIALVSRQEAHDLILKGAPEDALDYIGELVKAVQYLVPLAEGVEVPAAASKTRTIIQREDGRLGLSPRLDGTMPDGTVLVTFNAMQAQAECVLEAFEAQRTLGRLRDGQWAVVGVVPTDDFVQVALEHTETGQRLDTQVELSMAAMIARALITEAGTQVLIGNIERLNARIATMRAIGEMNTEEKPSHGRASENGWERVTPFDAAGRRAIWMRPRPTAGKPQALELCSGREGDDIHVELEGEVAAQVFDVLLHAQWAHDRDRDEGRTPTHVPRHAQAINAPEEYTYCIQADGDDDLVMNTVANAIEGPVVAEFTAPKETARKIFKAFAALEAHGVVGLAGAPESWCSEQGVPIPGQFNYKRPATVEITNNLGVDVEGGTAIDDDTHKSWAIVRFPIPEKKVKVQLDYAHPQQMSALAPPALGVGQQWQFHTKFSVGDNPWYPDAVATIHTTRDLADWRTREPGLRAHATYIGNVHDAESSHESATAPQEKLIPVRDIDPATFKRLQDICRAEPLAFPDFYRLCAIHMFDTNDRDVTDAQRAYAKNRVFTMMYGGTPEQIRTALDRAPEGNTADSGFSPSGRVRKTLRDLAKRFDFRIPQFLRDPTILAMGTRRFPAAGKGTPPQGPRVQMPDLDYNAVETRVLANMMDTPHIDKIAEKVQAIVLGQGLHEYIAATIAQGRDRENRAGEIDAETEMADDERFAAANLPTRLWCQPWEESEKNWGVRPDGYTLHMTPTDAKSYIKAFNDKLPEGPAPDVYTRPVRDGGYWIHATREQAQQALASQAAGHQGHRYLGTAPRSAE